MKQLKFLVDNLSAIETIEDVKQVLRKLKTALEQFQMSQQAANTTVNTQLSNISETLGTPIEVTLSLATDDGMLFIATDDLELIETEE